MRELIHDKKTGEVYSEPRYSIPELEKIRNFLKGAFFEQGLKEVDAFIAFLKDKRWVEEVLK